MIAQIVNVIIAQIVNVAIAQILVLLISLYVSINQQTTEHDVKYLDIYLCTHRDFLTSYVNAIMCFYKLI